MDFIERDRRITAKATNIFSRPRREVFSSHQTSGDVCRNNSLLFASRHHLRTARDSSFFCIFVLRRGRGSSFLLQVWTLRGWARWAQRVRGKLDPSIKRPPSTIFLPRHSARLSWVRSRSGRLAGIMCGIHPFKQSWRAAPAGPSFVVLRRGLWYPVITAVSSRMRITVKWKVRGWMKKCF